MGMIKAMSATVTRVFNTVTDVADAAAKVVDMGVIYIDQSAQEQKIVVRKETILSTAKSLAIIKRELDEDEELNAIYAELEKDWK